MIGNTFGDLPPKKTNNEEKHRLVGIEMPEKKGLG